MSTPEDRIRQAGFQLSAAHPVVGSYVKCVRAGSLLFVSGHGPFVDGQAAHTGKVGADLSLEEGQEAARAVILNILGTLKMELGELSRIARFVKLLVMVNAIPEYDQQHLVANGATDFLVQIFGDVGRPARTPMGVGSLPMNFAVEIEAVVEVQDWPPAAPDKLSDIVSMTLIKPIGQRG
ncbi:MAG TPA: RidA family protein [Ktedonobacterales bacterium]|nr:RidA family protein [Ktedonobacterales bacterium]